MTLTAPHRTIAAAIILISTPLSVHAAPDPMMPALADQNALSPQTSTTQTTPQKNIHGAHWVIDRDVTDYITATVTRANSPCMVAPGDHIRLYSSGNNKAVLDQIDEKDIPKPADGSPKPKLYALEQSQWSCVIEIQIQPDNVSDLTAQTFN